MENIDITFNFNQEKFYFIIIYLFNNREDVCSLNQFTDFTKSQNNCIWFVLFCFLHGKKYIKNILFLHSVMNEKVRLQKV